MYQGSIGGELCDEIHEDINLQVKKAGFLSHTQYYNHDTDHVTLDMTLACSKATLSARAHCAWAKLLSLDGRNRHGNHCRTQ